MRSRRWVVVVVALITIPTATAGAASLPGAPGCPMFPADSYWHARVDPLPRDPSSDTYVANAGSGSSLHADFGAGLYGGGPIGIPFTTVGAGQPKVPVSFEYADESDPGPYPIPPDAPIEGGAASTGDRHVLVVDRDACRDYEVYAAYPNGGGTSWSAGSGAVFDLTSNAMRPRTWTSADAAGLPILPGLVRYDEVASGDIDHAIRITLRRTDRRYVWPARHQAGSNDATAAPMGAWLRLKSTVDASRFGPQARVVVRALQQHGAIVADNGSSWYVSGAPDERWDNTDLHGLGALHGSDFEFVDASSLITSPDSGRVATAPPVRSDVPGGMTVDGWGGLHPFGVGAGPRPAAARGYPYWKGWDIARGVALLPDHAGGYVLDGWGGLHPFAIGTSALPPPATGYPYWKGWDIARGVTLLPDGSGGYVLDAWGGLHPFRIGTGSLPPAATSAPYWKGWDLARGVTLMPGGRSGYVVDATGGLSRVAFGGSLPPAATSVYRPTTPVIHGVALLPDGTSGYTLDEQGRLHAFAVGTTNPVAPATTGVATWTWSIARGVGL